MSSDQPIRELGKKYYPASETPPAEASPASETGAPTTSAASAVSKPKISPIFGKLKSPVAAIQQTAEASSQQPPLTSIFAKSPQTADASPLPSALPVMPPMLPSDPAPLPSTLPVLPPMPPAMETTQPASPVLPVIPPMPPEPAIAPMNIKIKPDIAPAAMPQPAMPKIVPFAALAQPTPLKIAAPEAASVTPAPATPPPLIKPIEMVFEETKEKEYSPKISKAEANDELITPKDIEHQVLIPVGTEIEGTIKTDRPLVVYGRVGGAGKSGGILQNNALIYVAKNAKVEANIQCNKLEIYGSADGDINAKEEILLHKGGKLLGKIQTPNFRTEPGSFFKGTMEMTGGDASPKIETPPPLVKPDKV